MAKRFTDSKKWDKPWYRKMKPKYKCLWDFITSKCDLIGVWDKDFESASYHIGEDVTEQEALKIFGDQITVVSTKKWLITDFVKFQYGVIDENPRSPIHRKIKAELDKIDYKYPIDRVYNTLQEEEEEKDKEEVKEKVEEVVVLPNIDFEDFWTAYDKKVGDKVKIRRKWDGLTDSEREDIMRHIPLYKASQPEKQYRKNPETYLNNKSWNDEIITSNGNNNQKQSSPSAKQSSLHSLVDKLRESDQYTNSQNHP